MSYNTSNPFDWGIIEPNTVSKEDSAETEFKTTPTLKDATYTEVAEETFTNTAFDSFVENIEAPTPQLRKVCGMECKKP